MNRADRVAEVVRLEQLAQVARDRAGELRKELGADAEAEWHEHSTAPTWRMDVATVSLPISHTQVVVSNPSALVEWCAVHHPTEVETVRRVRESFIGWLRANSRTEADPDGVPVVLDLSTDEPIPGLTWIPGGTPGSLSISATAEAKARYRLLAIEQLASLGLLALPGGEPDA